MKHLVLMCMLAVTGLSAVAQVNYKTREEVP